MFIIQKMQETAHRIISNRLYLQQQAIFIFENQGFTVERIYQKKNHEN